MHQCRGRYWPSSCFPEEYSRSNSSPDPAMTSSCCSAEYSDKPTVGENDIWNKHPSPISHAIPELPSHQTTLLLYLLNCYTYLGIILGPYPTYAAPGIHDISPRCQIHSRFDCPTLSLIPDGTVYSTTMLLLRGKSASCARLSRGKQADGGARKITDRLYCNKK